MVWWENHRWERETLNFERNVNKRFEQGRRGGSLEEHLALRFYMKEIWPLTLTETYWCYGSRKILDSICDYIWTITDSQKNASGPRSLFRSRKPKVTEGSDGFNWASMPKSPLCDGIKYEHHSFWRCWYEDRIKHHKAINHCRRHHHHLHLETSKPLCWSSLMLCPLVYLRNQCGFRCAYGIVVFWCKSSWQFIGSCWETHGVHVEANMGQTHDAQKQTHTLHAVGRTWQAGGKKYKARW